MKSAVFKVAFNNGEVREVSRHKINGRFALKKCTNYVTDEKWYCKIWNRFLVIKNYLSILAENGEIILAEIAVAPFVGAWIETPGMLRGRTS